MERKYWVRLGIVVLVVLLLIAVRCFGILMPWEDPKTSPTPSPTAWTAPTPDGTPSFAAPAQ